MTDFFIQCIPPKSTHQSAMKIFQVGGRPIMGKSKKGKKVEAELMSLLLPHRPEKPHSGAVRVEVDWVYPYRKSEPKKNLGKKIPCLTRPDCDNLMKFLGDCLERLGFFESGDAQISEVEFRKFYYEKSGIGIKISEVNYQ